MAFHSSFITLGAFILRFITALGLAPFIALLGLAAAFICFHHVVGNGPTTSNLHVHPWGIFLGIHCCGSEWATHPGRLELSEDAAHIHMCNGQINFLCYNKQLSLPKPFWIPWGLYTPCKALGATTSNDPQGPANGIPKWVANPKSMRRRPVLLLMKLPTLRSKCATPHVEALDVHPHVTQILEKHLLQWVAKLRDEAASNTVISCWSIFFSLGSVARWPEV